MGKHCHSRIHRKPISLRAALAAVMITVSGAAANAGDMIADQGGVLNPAEYTLEHILLKVERGELTDIECMYGYETAKHGIFGPARVIIRYCAENRKLPQSMTFMAWMDENGYGLETGPDLASAVEWDRRAAELGDSNAQYNYGLKLLRGRGVAKNVAEGRRYINIAAANGDSAAQKLVADNYDLNSAVGVGKDRLEKENRQAGPKVAKTN